MHSDYSNNSDYDAMDLVDAAEKPAQFPTSNNADLPDSVANSLLFELPREIRDRVYSYCLTSRLNLPIEWPSLWRPYDLQPQLLRTCKIIRDEAGPLLYTLNAQMFHHPSDANIFVRAFTSPVFGQQITHLNLHIKAQDMRLWMPYVTSTDPVRSVKADFPALKELEIRYRSNKWRMEQSVETNMRIWSDDSRLEEIMDGLRHVFLGVKKGDDSSLFWDSTVRLSLPGQSTDEMQHWDGRPLPQAMKPYVRSPDEPLLRVTCACRVNSEHFEELTTPGLVPEPQATFAEDTDSTIASASPVKEGDMFRGFSAVDLQHNVKQLYDQEAGSADVAQTPFTDKRGVLLSLEVHCLHPKKET
ncbi:unnamed protein product [Zymoseptoria tritici ST99CH_1E4]|uniref:F-box domain-containing protein n=1 Tax=Zymoseptoria tritici ST99CH_1E4 TaxID=1276532 RepID=A0A2H1FYK2_ZYMTR|nr:unnamed protein product [Zymoseptoria tritici ST99CH_1E4]